MKTMLLDGLLFLGGQDDQDPKIPAARMGRFKGDRLDAQTR